MFNPEKPAFGPDPENSSNLHEEDKKIGTPKLTAQRLRNRIIENFRQKLEQGGWFKIIKDEQKIMDMARDMAPKFPATKYPFSEEEREEIVSDWNKRWVEALPKDLFKSLMNMVRDINTPGTAYSLVDRSALPKIIKNGLTGRGADDESLTKDEQIEKLTHPVFFNIVGRGLNDRDLAKDSLWSKQGLNEKDTIKNCFWLNEGKELGKRIVGISRGLDTLDH